MHSASGLQNTESASANSWPSPNGLNGSGGSARCDECAAPLAHDQRYCVECGARRGPLAPSIAARVAHGDPANSEPSADAAGAIEPPDDGGATKGGWSGGLPPLAPSAVAVAVMGVLAFGVGVGWAVSPGEEAPELVAAAPPATTTTPPAASSTAPPAASSTPPTEAAASASAAPSTEAPASSASSTPASSSSSPSSPASKAPKSSKPKPSAPSAPAGTLPPIKHVFLIVLSDQTEGKAFGASSPAPYLANTLTKQGELLPGYYAVSTGELANMDALISGQGPTPQTVANCPLYTEITPGTAAAEGQVLGGGCVYPQQTLTVASQLTSAGKTWRAYVEGTESGGPGAPISCRHPVLGSADPNQAPSATNPYVTWSNPFVYFDSITSTPACAQDDVGIEQLSHDLASASKTPSLSFIVPDRCHDGSEEPCAPGQPAGLAATDPFLEKVVQEIELSPAYGEGGLIAITFDRAPQSGPEADPSGCCITATYPNLPTGTLTTSTTTTTTSGGAPPSAGAQGAGLGTTVGGGKVGLLLISKYVKPGSVDAIGQYDHFALLLSIEQLFKLKPLGYAGAPGLLAFDTTVYNAFK